VSAVIDKIVFKHKILTSVHEALRNVNVGGKSHSILSVLEKEECIPYVHLGLRMAAEYGDPIEVVSAAKLANLIERRGVRNWFLQDSLRYALHRSMDAQLEGQLRICVEAFSQCERPVVQQYAPKLIPLCKPQPTAAGAHTG